MSKYLKEKYNPTKDYMSKDLIYLDFIFWLFYKLMCLVSHVGEIQ